MEQTTQENCVSHLPSLVPVPGRDIITQAWYQGGVSVIDFTDAANPKEIAFYDRGPISATALVLGGLWSSYYYNGAIYGSEIARGFDVWGLTPNDQLSENEILAASEIELERLTPQHQPQFTHAPSFAVVRSFRDQLERAGDIDAKTLDQVDKFVDRAERVPRRRQGRRRKGAAQRDREPAQGRRVRCSPRRPARARGLVGNSTGEGRLARPSPRVRRGCHTPPSDCGREERLRMQFRTLWRGAVVVSLLALAFAGAAPAADEDTRGIDPNQGRSLVEVHLDSKADAIALQLEADEYGIDFNDHYLRHERQRRA